VKFRELIRLLEEDGWQLVAQRGSRQQYEHPSKPGKVTVAGKPGADVPRGTAANILRRSTGYEGRTDERIPGRNRA
jgi:predicted RNA binding protein YcfA (HicA-like mRNA interferase family)